MGNVSEEVRLNCITNSSETLRDLRQPRYETVLLEWPEENPKIVFRNVFGFKKREVCKNVSQECSDEREVCRKQRQSRCFDRKIGSKNVEEVLGNIVITL